MKQILAIPAYTMCPLCGDSLEVERGSLYPQTRTTVGFYHHKRAFAPLCQNEGKTLNISVKEFLLPKDV